MKRWTMALCALWLTGCAAPGPERYREEKPRLDLRTYFNGTVDGWGMFQSRSGEIKKRFTVRIDASWEGPTGTLDEHFLWSDGSRTRRVWTLTDLGKGRYEGRAADVVGIADGETGGPVLNWAYTMALEVDGSTYHVHFDDWMVLVDEQVLLNRATMRKWGFRLGEVTLAFRRR